VTLDEKAQKEIAKIHRLSGIARGQRRRLKDAPDWSPASLEKVLRDLAEQRHVAAARSFSRSASR